MNNQIKVAILQCTRCLAVLGDTTRFVCVDSKLGVFVISQVPPGAVLVERDCAEYDGLICAKCKLTVGKMFLKRTNIDPRLLHKYAFDADAFVAYELTVPIPPQLQKIAHSEKSTQELENQANSNQKIQQLEERLASVESLLCYLFETRETANSDAH